MRKTTAPLIQTSLCAFTLLAPISCLNAAEFTKESIEVSASSRLLVMGRDYGNGLDGSSASASLSIKAKSDLPHGFSVGAKSVFVQNLFEDGVDNAAYWLSNDSSTSLSEAYLQYALSSNSTQETKIILGRKEASYSFFPAYNVRHQAQAMEGLFANTKVGDHLSLDIGHIESFSSWPSRENGVSSLDTSFKKIGERVGHSDIHSSVQFAAADWTKNNLSLNAYDYHAAELYNNAGLKLSYTLPTTGNDAKWTMSAHAIKQQGTNNGALDKHDAGSIELNLRYKRNKLSVDTGWTHISSSASLLVPFRTTNVNDATLLWYTNQFEAGTNTAHAKLVYSNNPWTLAAVFVHASHLDDRTESELDLVAKRKMNEKLSLCIKAGYGKCVFDEDDRHHKSATDLRLFVDYKL